MTILYHHRTLADGAEGIHIAEMIAAFRALGHEVHVRGLTADSRPAATARRRSIERIRRLVPRALFELAAMGLNVLDYLDVRRALRELRPDFVYKRHARFDVGAGLAARHAGIPVVLEVNCLFSHADYRAFEPSSFGFADRAFERWALRLAAVRLAVSSPLARQIVEHGRTTALVMPNGTNPDRFNPDSARGAEIRSRFGVGGAFVVGWTGVIREWHELNLLLEAVARVPRAVLLIVGDGTGRAQLEAGARNLGLDGRLVVTGRVPHDDVPNYVAAMDVAVVASDRTGVASPMKLLEYMAMKRAVVAPRLANISDVVQDGREARLFNHGDAQDLAAALTALAADPAERVRLGDNAREAIETLRNWRSNAERVLALVTPFLSTRSSLVTP